MAGLSVGGFIGIVVVILILNVAGVVAYYKLGMKEKILAREVVSSELAPKLRYGLLGLLFLSWIFSIACTAACTFLKVEQNIALGAFGIYGGSATVYYGLHGAEFAGNCVSGNTGDDRINTAYAFAILNNLLTSAVLIGCPLVIFNVIKDANTANKVWKIMGFLMLASTWCCLFTFYMQQTTFCTGSGNLIDCSLGGAGVAQVFNTIFLIGICVLFFVLPLPASEDGGKNEEDDNGGEKKDEEENKKEESEEENKKKDAEEEGDDGSIDSVEVEEP